jgi:hypothetical protein
MASDSSRKSAYLSPFFVALLALVAINIGAELFVFLGFMEIFLFALYFPFLEELFKFYVRMRRRSQTFCIIVCYAIAELVVAKIPIIQWNTPEELANQIFYSLIALNFHLSTAYVYDSNRLGRFEYIVLMAMIFIHALYNVIDLFLTSHVTLMMASVFLSFTPYLVLVLFHRLPLNQR